GVEWEVGIMAKRVAAGRTYQDFLSVFWRTGTAEHLTIPTQKMRTTKKTARLGDKGTISRWASRVVANRRTCCCGSCRRYLSVAVLAPAAPPSLPPAAATP